MTPTNRISSFVLPKVLAVLAALSFQPLGHCAPTDKPPAPETVSIHTKDGVELKATYYGSNLGKQATPVVLLADWKDSRSVYDNLARQLQTPTPPDKQLAPGEVPHKSFAVLAVDLRGHGDSTKQRLPGGNVREIDAAKLDRNDLAAMVRFDMEGVRSFLVDKNDEGKLNINRLSILGSGLGASVAVNWTAVDWSAPPLAVGKQGQDVKAVVLVSPEWSYKGLQMSKALKQPGVRSDVAYLIMFGKKDRGLVSDVKRIERQLENYHPKPDSLKPDEPHSLVVLDADVGLQGTKFLTEYGSQVDSKIIKFFSVHVADKDFEWTERRRN